MKIRYIILAASIAAGFLAEYGRAGGEHTHVARIIDGDTFDAEDGRRIRIWGIDAPEMDQLDGPLAWNALAVLTALEPLICEQMDIDRYGRSVERCETLDGRDIACEMVRQGMARDWPRFSGGYYRECER